MDKTTKKEALDKLNKMVSLLDYPKELLNDTKLNEHYKKFVIDRKSIIKTELSFNRVIIEESLQSLDKPVNQLDWTGVFGAASTVNAFYAPTSNSISLYNLDHSYNHLSENFSLFYFPFHDSTTGWNHAIAFL